MLRLCRDAPERVLLSLFIMASGCAALTYQVVWVRLLGLSMGSTSASIATVVAAFFLGLALGSYFAEKISRFHIRSIATYLWLELLIGLFGLALLPVLLHLDYLMLLFPLLGESVATKFAVAMVLFIVPTVCMGATFPVVAVLWVRGASHVGRDLSLLYSLNTAGAVLGACASGFVLIPTIGLDGAVYLAVGLNLGIVALGVLNRRLWVSRSDSSTPPENSAVASAAIATPEFGRAIALAALFATGFASIATEVGWTKYLSIFTGTTIYGFAAILTVFLVGIAAGSWWVRKHISEFRQPHVYLAVGLVLLGAAFLLTRSGLGAVPALFQAVNHIDAPSSVIHGVKYVSIFLLLLVPTMLLGALFPLNLMLYCGGLRGVESSLGRAYAVNTLAGIVGSVVAGFWIIPHFGTDILLVICAIAVLAIPLMYIATAISGAAKIAIGTGALMVASFYFFLPGIDYSRLIASVGYAYDKDVRENKTPRVLYLEEGKAGVISVVSYDDESVKIQNNGLNESVLYPDDPTRGLVSEQLLGLIPYLVHRQPRSAFVVGFGGGVTTRMLADTDVESIRVVELEPAVIHAGRSLARGEIPVLADPRVTLEFNDARNTLLLDQARYDIIVSQPSHPWLVGAANVYTTQFFELAKSRLNEGGIYGQWVNLFNMDATTLRIIFNTFYSVFPEGVSFANVGSGDYLLFGSDRPIAFDFAQMEKRMNKAPIKAALAHHDVYSSEDLMWYFALSRDEMTRVSSGYDVNTDTNLLTEVRLSKLINVPDGDENPYNFLFANFSFDLSSYLAEDELVTRYYSLARRFLGWDSPDVARRIKKILESLNETYARSVDYEIRRYEARDHSAAAFYRDFNEWTDPVHDAQSEYWVESGSYSLAEKAAAKISDNAMREIAVARLHYFRGDDKALAAMHVSSAQARKWQLIGLGRTDITRAGQELLKLNLDPRNDPALLRTLLRYAATGKNTAILDKYARLLAQSRSDYEKHLVELAGTAFEKGELDYATQLVEKIARNNPESGALVKLRKRLTKEKTTIAGRTDPVTPIR